jgi:thiol-disulfide isomerase/thioredoxin
VSATPPVRLRRRLLVGSLAVALLISVLGGWAWSRFGDGDDPTAEDGDRVVLDTPGVFQEPTIATNAPVGGTPFPDVALQRVNGDDVQTGELIGTPMVVNVWFTTCPPCRRELPAFAAVHEALGDQVRFVGINPRDDGAAAVSFAEERGVRYETLLDPDGQFLTAAGIGTFPSTLFVAADGTIVAQRAGEIDQATLEDVIAEVLL